ncbi:uncharacterized protein LOC115686490 [Syzygium oleosum]|uniref:uncharacterized protein LOC115686490 n=1 Tax=Syzygium oleosum TaxID=219896 RepID=UPI0024B90AE1|nr:uncharacterized protein LOC115686490 [Syzygium oleosum]
MAGSTAASLACLPSLRRTRPVLSSRSPSPPPRLRAGAAPSPSSPRAAAARGSLAAASLLGAGCLALALASAASAAAAAEPASLLVVPSLQLAEPANALSLPTWAVHVSSVAEWITAMALVWQYGEVSGYESWKGLSWGMVPLLGGAFCACTWHFFYNSESLEVLVALQAALTVIGNATMCFAAFRIYRASEERSGKL